MRPAREVVHAEYVVMRERGDIRGDWWCSHWKPGDSEAEWEHDYLCNVATAQVEARGREVIEACAQEARALAIHVDPTEPADRCVCERCHLALLAAERIGALAIPTDEGKS